MFGCVWSMVGTGQEGVTGQHKAGQDGGGQAGWADGAGQHGQCCLPHPPMGGAVSTRPSLGSCSFPPFPRRLSLLLPVLIGCCLSLSPSPWVWCCSGASTLDLSWRFICSPILFSCSFWCSVFDYFHLCYFIIIFDYSVCFHFHFHFSFHFLCIFSLLLRCSCFLPIFLFIFFFSGKGEGRWKHARLNLVFWLGLSKATYVPDPEDDRGGTRKDIAFRWRTTLEVKRTVTGRWKKWKIKCMGLIGDLRGVERLTRVKCKDSWD